MANAIDIFRQLAKPLDPEPTGAEPSLRRLEGIRVVLFDLYGTLLVSGSGEVGIAAAASDTAAAEAFAAVGLETAVPSVKITQCLFDTILAMHDELRAAGRDWPEVDIRVVWPRVLAALASEGGVDPAACEKVDVARLAVEYEARANTAWLMPGAAECLAGLRAGGRVLGIISNAQFYTLDLMEALFGFRAEPLGFDPALQFYSYQHGWGKPSRRLFEMAVHELAERSIRPAEALCVGNDMLNDVLAARDVGFRTALFAGDARSLRLREDDPQVKEVKPDLILTRLGQLLECIIY
ncbi:MAG TPA: HAD family hydrolase [Thermoguttaceae bacterium]|nr:HAD family hydrolase [Thermoguttaceae bacterium]